jgi:hypothetical protein
VSDQPRHGRLSRVDPINWPPGTGVVLFVAWLAYAIACTVWIHQLIWTVLPIGLTLYLFAERYPWRLIVALVAPLTLLTALSQVVAAWSDVSTSVAFAIYLVGCAYFSLVLCVPNRDRWVARLPRWLLGKQFAARLAWTRFEESLVAANAVVRQVDADADQGRRQATMNRLASQARRESRRGGIWQEAWSAYATWLEGIASLVGLEISADKVHHVHDLLADLDGAHMLAIEQTALLDPAGE